MRLSRQKWVSWSELEFLSSGYLPNSGIRPILPTLAADSLPMSHHESPISIIPFHCIAVFLCFWFYIFTILDFSVCFHLCTYFFDYLLLFVPLFLLLFFNLPLFECECLRFFVCVPIQLMLLLPFLLRFCLSILLLLVSLLIFFFQFLSFSLLYCVACRDLVLQ